MHIVIKKEYASSLIDQLIKDEAIELIGERETDIEITEEQKEAVLKAIQSVKDHPESARPWIEVRKKYKFLK